MEMDIGSRLKEARETKGLSLEEVQNTTKIQKRYLQAIEENEFKVLPGKFYTRAFIREYASAVGLDPEMIMQEHKNELPTYEDEETVQYSRVQKTKQQTNANSSNSSKLFPSILTIVVIIGVIFAVYMYFMNNNNAENEPTGQAETNDEINVPVDTEDTQSNSGDGTSEKVKGNDSQNKTDQTGSEQDSESKKENSSPEAEKSEMKIELVQEGNGSFPEHSYTVTGASDRKTTIELKGEVYLEVKAPKTGTDLTPPAIYDSNDSPITLSFDGKDQLYIKTGSAPNTIVKINGEKVPFPNPEQSTQKLLFNFE